MATLALPKSFFLKERDSIYDSWHLAFWRELVSNSIDAGSSQISIATSCEPRHPGGDESASVFRVSFADNGSGMTRETLEDVYFKLGASSKERDSDGVGGFGRARILTCFSQVAYSIRTLDCEVRGDGATYSLIDGLPRQRGCTVTVDVEPKDADALTKGLQTFLRECQIDCDITIDGERFTDWCRKGRGTRVLGDPADPFAVVHVNRGDKAQQKARCIVRVNGVSMFSPWVRKLDAQVVIEIVPSKSRGVLTASRDAFRQDYREVLEKFIQDLSSDKSATLATRSEVVVTLYRGAGVAAASPDDTRKLKLGSSQPGRVATEPRGSTQQPETVKFGRGDDTGRLPADLPDMIIRVQSPNAETRRSLVKFQPENWSRNSGEGGSARILYALWVAACEHAVAALLRARPHLGSVNYIPGLLFDTPEPGATYIRGLHARIKSNDPADTRRPHGILLNPVDDKGRMLYSVSSKEDRKALLAIAKHEAAHFIHEFHDEEFASLLTFIDAAFDERAAFQRMEELAGKMRSAFGARALVQEVKTGQRMRREDQPDLLQPRPWQRRMASDFPLTVAAAGMAMAAPGASSVAAAVASTVAGIGGDGVLAVDTGMINELERLFAEGAMKARIAAGREQNPNHAAGDELQSDPASLSKPASPGF